MTLITRSALVLSILLAFSCHRAPSDLKRHFDGIDGAFVLLDLNADQYVRYNPERCAQRFSPCSTFKIPHALIALETQAVENAEHLIRWDQEKYPTSNPSWARDHTLRTAFRNSAVWYFRETAGTIGQEAMQDHLNRLDYGNRDLSSGLDGFWLRKSLEISADEQVAFIKRFYTGQFGYSEKHTATVKEMLLREEAASYKLSAKTGSNGRGLGWLVGYVEKDDNVYFFAYNAQLPKDKASVSQRLNLVKEILRDLRILPLMTPLTRQWDQKEQQLASRVSYN